MDIVRDLFDVSVGIPPGRGANPDWALAPSGWGGYPGSDRGLAIGVVCGGEAGDGRSFASRVGCAHR